MATLDPPHLSNVTWFRGAAPYINAHRGRVAVVHLGPGLLGGPAFAGVLADVALLATLGLRLVVVYSAETSQGAKPTLVVDETAFEQTLIQVGRLRFEIEARLSMALGAVPLRQRAIRISSGNFVRARPSGIRDGRDMQRAGELRGLDHDGIRAALDDEHVVLVPPIGYSPSGELFQLDSLIVAERLAIELSAAKLLVLDSGLTDPQGRAGTHWSLKQTREHLAQARNAGRAYTPAERVLSHLANVCALGVRRGHMLDSDADGVLILELFTRDGIGTMVAADIYDDTRNARPADIPAIVELIEPLERSGALVTRPREKLEQDIEHFVVMERDKTVVACAALYPLDSPGTRPPRHAELACLAVHPAYRASERGDTLLRYAETRAKAQGVQRLVVLTTQAEHWFRERGFELASPDALPQARKNAYSGSRNSKVLVKRLP